MNGIGAVLEVLEGSRAIANFERRKDPEAYAYISENLEWIEDVVEVFRWDGPEGAEYVIAEDADYILAFLGIIFDDSLSQDARYTAMGRLFGYSETAIADYIQSPAVCDCSKCKGAGYVDNVPPRHPDRHTLSHTLKAISTPNVRR